MIKSKEHKWLQGYLHPVHNSVKSTTISPWKSAVALILLTMLTMTNANGKT
jgi:hypothetical protein